MQSINKSPSFFALSILENKTNNWPNVNSDNPSGSISIPFPGGPGGASISNGTFTSEFLTGPSVDSGSVITMLFSAVVGFVSKFR